MCYRPPKQLDFFSLLENSCITCTNFSDSECLLLGDFNTDYQQINSKTNQLTVSLKHFMSMFDLSQIIKNPTRITKLTSTILDLILVSDPNKISNSGVLSYSVSDHQMIYCTRKIRKSPGKQTDAVKLRSMKNYTKEAFNVQLQEVDWREVLECNTVEEAWSIFKCKFLATIDKISPIRQIRLKQNTVPWMTGEILHLIHDRDQVYCKFKKTKDHSLYDRYIFLRNQVQNKKVQAKSDFLTDKLNVYKKQPKKLWQTIKSLGTSSQSRTKPGSVGLNIENELCFEKSKVTEQFNKFFTTIASTLVDHLPPGTGKYGWSHIQKFYQSIHTPLTSFKLMEVSESIVLKILQNLNSTKATGLDQLSPRFVKDGAEVIMSPLTHILNLSLVTGIIPDDLKSARVTPIYKKNSKTEAGNYRPVSILSTISKLFERVVYNQLDQYLQDHKLLYEYQSGFRSAFSTDTCLVHLTDYIKQEQDKGNYVGMVLLDLQKAFDTVDHGILIQKLTALGLDNSALNWFRSYLHERQQSVEISGVTSTTARITCGVPQGSILSPMLFLIYVNDISSAVKCKLLLYADDSALIVPGKNTMEIQQELSNELESIREWLIDNKLSLHLGKTESILFASKRKLHTNNSIQVQCAGNVLSCRTKVKYLGVELDQSLAGDCIADKIISKSNSKLKFLYRQTRNVNLETKKMLTAALIQCHFDYASSSWYSGLTKKYKARLQCTQNKIVRFLLKAPPRTHIGANEFRLVNMLPVELRAKQLKLNLVHNILNGTAPDYLNTAFKLTRSQHNINTRSGTMSLQIPHVKSFGKNTFNYTGILAWNELPTEIKCQTSKFLFKKGVKQFLFDNLNDQEASSYILF